MEKPSLIGLLAQLVELMAHNRLVVGSSPTKSIGDIVLFTENYSSGKETPLLRV